VFEKLMNGDIVERVEVAYEVEEVEVVEEVEGDPSLR
jgi:hypothetical protein